MPSIGELKEQVCASNCKSYDAVQPHIYHQICAALRPSENLESSHLLKCADPDATVDLEFEDVFDMACKAAPEWVSSIVPGLTDHEEVRVYLERAEPSPRELLQYMLAHIEKRERG